MSQKIKLELTEKDFKVLRLSLSEYAQVCLQGVELRGGDIDEALRDEYLSLVRVLRKINKQRSNNGTTRKKKHTGSVDQKNKIRR